MKIALSAHFDLAKKVNYIKLDAKHMTGLVDNFAGVFVAYQAARKTGVDIYLTNFEEINLKGANQVAKDTKSDKDTLFIVVDTCTDAKGKKAYIGNAYHINVEPLKKKFAKDIQFVDGYYEPTEDETAAYGWDYKRPAFFFGVPITGTYHATDNQIALKTMDEATKLLIEVIKFLQKNAKKVLITN